MRKLTDVQIHTAIDFRENYYSRRPKPVEEHYVTIKPYWADAPMRMPLLIAHKLKIFSWSDGDTSTCDIKCWACSKIHTHGLIGEFFFDMIPFKITKPIYDFRASHCRVLESRGYESYAILFDKRFCTVIDERK